MDRDSAAQQQDWKIVKAVLLRQFPLRGLVVLALLVGALWRSAGGARLGWGAMLGGGWMLANCAALAWVGIRALSEATPQPERHILVLFATMLGSLAVGGVVAVVVRPSLLGLSLGLSAVLGIFVWSLSKVKSRISASHVG
ncbi:MAG: hypothetical protein HYZ92_00130 [Candidatus Omnitrophica bacterium]|nr:hypothetical protein [Candidatus Omnitrophota bacterium]